VKTDRQDIAVTARSTELSPASHVVFEWSRVDNPHWVGSEGLRVLCGFSADETYRPLKSELALFRTFASLPDTEDAFAAFAGRYGDLYDADYLVRNGRVLSHDDGLDEGSGFDGVGNTFAVWRAHRGLLAFALRLWDALNEGRSRDVIGADLVLTATPDGVIDDSARRPCMRIKGRIGKLQLALGVHPSAIPAIGGEYSWLGYASKSSSPDAILRSALATLITEMCGSVDVAMEVSSAQAGGLRLTFEVSSLIGAMWLQFALAVDGNREYRSCPECGEWWDSTETRSDRQTCSDRCRKRRHRAEVLSQQTTKRGK
jgi:hypothetical protein